MKWKPIDSDAKTGHEVLLGFAGSLEMDFYRWNPNLAVEGQDPEIFCWSDRTADYPHERPTHYMIIDPPA